MTINAYYTDQELRTQRTNLEAMGYVEGRNERGAVLIFDISKELHRRAAFNHPSSATFGPDEIYDQDIYDQDGD